MHKIKIHIQRLSVLLILLLSSVVTFAQLTAQVGDTTELSVSEVSGDTYTWELYDVAIGVNFATEAGNCPSSKAYFVNGKNTGSSVTVKWLAEGVYFYKVTARNTCTNNIKIGRIEITSADIPPTPNISITYDCDERTAILTASGYTGDLLWSTGETSESITVTKAGVYTLTQTVNKRQSKEATITVQEIKADMPVNVAAIPPKIIEGGVSALTAEGCQNGMLHWYSDKELTKELMNTEVSPKETTTYYVVCESNAGCQSKAIAVTVEVDKFTDEKCKELYKTIRIEQLITPNADGYNDTWELNDVLKYCTQCGKSVMLRLYNRWGAKVYEKEGYMLDSERFEGYSNNGLDYMNSKKLPDGTYFYLITVEGEKEKTGFINIVASGAEK